MNSKATYVNLSVGNACNLRCKFCYNDTSREDKQFFEDINVLKKKLLNYKFKGKKTVNIIGGEPLIYPDFFKLLDFLKEENFIVTIVTNGISLGDESFFNKINTYKEIIKNINVSIHSHNDNLEDIITLRKGVFEKKLLGIENLKKTGIRFSLSLVINKFNLPFLEEILDFYYKKYGIILSLQSILLFNNSSDENKNSMAHYSEVIKSINALKSKILYIHWIPLCIHNNILNLKYVIRELDRKFLFSHRADGKNLLNAHITYNKKIDECNKCYAYGKFCFGPSKKYLEKFGKLEFNLLSKEQVKKLILISNFNKERIFVDGNILGIK